MVCVCLLSGARVIEEAEMRSAESAAWRKLGQSLDWPLA